MGADFQFSGKTINVYASGEGFVEGGLGEQCERADVHTATRRELRQAGAGNLAGG